MNRKVFFEYLLTIVKTIIVASIIVSAMVWSMEKNIYSEEAKKEVQDEAIDYYLVGIMIDKNHYLENKDPKNYNINIKLGMLYQIKKNYKDAEAEFKKAVSKAPYGEVKPKFKLVSLYLFQNRLDEAEEILNNIDESPNVNTIKEKASLYYKLGDKYYNLANYEDAIPRYRKALFYYNTIKDPETKNVENSIASAYVYLADNYIQKLDIDDAINSLQMALTIVDAPIIKYKLAILYIKDKPDLAEKYFEEVFIREPSIINYDTYNKFLNQISLESEERGDIAKAELCGYKIKKLEDYHFKNILSVGDVSIENIKGKIKTNHWGNKYIITLNFNLRNDSAHNINTLYLQIVFIDGENIIDEYNEKVADEKSIFKLNSAGPTIHIKATEPRAKSDNSLKEITAQIYASKTDTNYKILLSEIKIKEQPKSPNSWIKQLRRKLYLLFHGF